MTTFAWILVGLFVLQIVLWVAYNYAHKRYLQAHERLLRYVREWPQRWSDLEEL